MACRWMKGKAKHKAIVYQLLSVLLLLCFAKVSAQVKVGAERTSEYVHLLKGKRVALVANQTSLINNQHILDTLISLGVKVEKVFTLEHGFRGAADAGEKVESSFDAKTGVKMVSLYGKNKKPKPEDLAGLDWIVYDIQDVGVRFYTYISSLHYIMEAAAEQKTKILLLDRPNPHGFYIDGPILEMKYKSFVGMHAVPVVHGLTIAEYAQMINGEAWLANKVKAELRIVSCKNYTHTTRYKLPVKPSPNLPNMQAVYLYPSLCFFEGTNVSVGRGTDAPFQIYGSPDLLKKNYTFTPESRLGAKFPPHLDKLCFGQDLRKEEMKHLEALNISWLIDAYQSTADKGSFFNDFFTKLAGNDKLKQQIVDGIPEEIIRQSWKQGLEEYKLKRKKYLIYPDFE